MMIDCKEVAVGVFQHFRELSAHEINLAARLQSLVPSNKQPPSRSAQYLYESGLMLKELSEKVKDLMLVRSSTTAPGKLSGSGSRERPC